MPVGTTTTGRCERSTRRGTRRSASAPVSTPSDVAAAARDAADPWVRLRRCSAWLHPSMSGTRLSIVPRSCIDGPPTDDRHSVQPSVEVGVLDEGPVSEQPHGLVEGDVAA